MPPVLVAVEDAAQWLGITSETEKASLGPLVEAVESHLANITGVTFADAGAVTDEPHDGTGTPVLWANRPVSALSAVKLGRDVANPTATLDVTDTDVIVIDPRYPRRLVRPLGAVFPKGSRNVHLSYTALDSRAAEAAQAVKEAVAFVWRRRGGEEARSERIGSYVRELNTSLMRLPMWKAYVQARATKVL